MSIRATSLVVVLCACACAGADSGFAPSNVASVWVTQSLDKEPDVVVSVDVVGLQRDAFFGKLSDLVMADAPIPFDAVRGARQVDFFGTVHKTFTAVVYGAGSLPPELERCLASTGRDPVSVSTVGGKWLISTGHATGAVPSAVSMNGGALIEAWMGPGAVDEALDHARWETREMWAHLHALRMRIEGGSTPGIVVDARFETSVDAEHAQYDLARMQRALERVATDIHDDELTRQLLAQLPNVHVARDGTLLKVDFHLTEAFIQYISPMLDHGLSRHRRRHGCD
jgi:hypothetical protein